MQVSEQDIFNYTFFSEDQDKNISNEIRKMGDLQPVINFNLGLKNEIESDISFNKKVALNKAIPDYAEISIITKPIKILSNREFRGIIFPNISKSKKNTFGVYQDDMKDITIQTYCIGGTTLLTILPNWNIKLKNFSIKILPQNKEYKIGFNTVHIDIGQVSDIEAIEIIFNWFSKDHVAYKHTIKYRYNMLHVFCFLISIIHILHAPIYE